MMLPFVKLPTLELAGQVPTFDLDSQSQLQKMSEFQAPAILNYSNNPRFWCQLLKFGHNKGWLSEECIFNAINGSTTYEAQLSFLNSLEEYLDNFKSEVESHLSKKNMISNDRIVKYINDNFAFNLEISIHDYYEQKPISLKLVQDNATLSVLEMDYISQLPKPLKEIGVSLTSLLCTLGSKALSSDVLQYSISCTYITELLDGITKDDVTVLSNLLSGYTEEEASPLLKSEINDILSKLNLSIDELFEEFGGDWRDVLLEQLLQMQIHHATEESNLVTKVGIKESIECIKDCIVRYNNTNEDNDDVFQRFKEITEILESFVEDGNPVSFESGSDAQLSEFSIITFNSEIEENSFDEINNLYNDIGEFPYLIVDLQSPSVLQTLKNIALSDILLSFMVDFN